MDKYSSPVPDNYHSLMHAKKTKPFENLKIKKKGEDIFGDRRRKSLKKIRKAHEKEGRLTRHRSASPTPPPPDPQPARKPLSDLCMNCLSNTRNWVNHDCENPSDGEDLPPTQEKLFHDSPEAKKKLDFSSDSTISWDNSQQEMKEKHDDDNESNSSSGDSCEEKYLNSRNASAINDEEE